MNTQQILFLIINFIGGPLVLLSYIIGLKAGKSADILWGGTPKKIRGVYTISMLISAISFLITSVFIFLIIKDPNILLPYSLSMSIFNILYTILLLCSAIWIPLVNRIVNKPSKFVWLSIRLGLIFVGLSALGILMLLIGITPQPTTLIYWISIAGMGIFFIHTGILDAFLWPYFWKK